MCLRGIIDNNVYNYGSFGKEFRRSYSEIYCHKICEYHKDCIMMNIYKDPAHAGSFGGVDSLHRAIGKKVSKKQLRKWLEGVDSYTLHKPVRHNFVRNRVIVYGIDEQWQAYLVDLVSI